MNRIKIGFLGYGTRALDALMEHDGFEVVMFLAPVSRLCTDVYDAKKRYPGLEFGLVNNNDEVYDAFSKAKEKVDCFLMNACPIILNEKVLSVMPVYNIHPGDLNKNRGHQPHMWTVLLGEESSMIVLHSVTPKIDEGDIISRVVRDIKPDMDSLEVLDMLEDEVPALLDGLYDHLVKNTPPVDRVNGGEYRQIMVYDDYRFDPDDMNKPGFLDDVLRKIRARITKNGAFFIHEGKRIYVDKLLDDEVIGSVGESAKIEFHGSVVFCEKENRRLVFNVKKKESNA